MTSSFQRSYPLRVGDSIRSPNYRSSLSLNFEYMPPEVDLTQGGIVRREGDKCQVHLPTNDGKTMSFNGSRPQESNQNLQDYILVLVDGVLWLERSTDFFNGIRGGATSQRSITNLQDENHDSPEADPDSWMSNEGATTSTASQVEDEGENGASPDVLRQSVGHKSVGGKGLTYDPRGEEEHEPQRYLYDSESASDSVDSSSGSDSTSDSGSASD